MRPSGTGGRAAAHLGELAHGAIESVLQRLALIRRQRPEARPRRLGAADFLLGGALTRILRLARGAGAHRVGGERFAPLAREQLGRRHQAFELRDGGFAVLHLALERGRVAVLEALEEQVAGAAELVPDRVRLALLHRADRLPINLQPLDARRGLFPLGRFGELLRFGDERFLALEVLGPVLLALLEIVLAAREETIACGAEALPDGFFVAAG